ncbi:MAG TPA: inosine/xanthosine triphosphatase [Gemmatirosa sp.]
MPSSPPLGRLSHVLTVAVGSTNPVKIAAVRAVFARIAPHARVTGIPVPSGVPDQPWGDDETRRGATVRAAAAREALSAELGVGIEGGVVDEAATSATSARQLRTCAWAAVAEPDGAVHLGGSLAMPLPRVVADRVRAGVELGHAMDALLGASGTKHGGGAVGVLTAGLIDRQQAYEVIVTYALAPLLVPMLPRAEGDTS